MRYSYKGALKRLTEYAIKEGYETVLINHGAESWITWDGDSLNEPHSLAIGTGHTFEIQTYIMLHELGHHELRKDWDKFEKRLPVIAHAEKKCLKKKKEYKYKRRGAFYVSTLEEEFLAWEEGLKLGTRFGIKINMDRWIRFKSKSLKTYINYYGTLNK